jgi:hypothetical protein
VWKASSRLVLVLLLAGPPADRGARAAEADDPPAVPEDPETEIPPDMEEFLGVLEMLEEYGDAVAAEAALQETDGQTGQGAPEPAPEPSGR